MKPVPTGPPGIGFKPEEWEVLAINRELSTVSKGDLVRFDMTNVSTDVNTAEAAASRAAYGDDDHPLSNILLSLVADVSHAQFGVALEDIAAEESGRVLVQGTVTATINIGTPPLTAGGTPLINGAGELIDTATAGKKIIGLTLTAVAADGDALIIFDGLNGFGIR